MSGLRWILARTIAFVVVSALCAAAVVVVYGTVRFDDSVKYVAMFSDASGLQASDDVRVAGVTVGRVEDVTVDADNQARVEFTLDEQIPLSTAVEAVVRYKNLLGQRFLEMRQGDVAAAGATVPLGADGVIPASQTKPALDLDELYNGFSPLFQGLEPAQVNDLAESLISVFQGQGGTVQTLLAQVGSLTSTLADKDQVIGEVVTNLNGVLGTINERGDQVSELVVQLQQLVSGLSGDRATLGEAITRADAFAGTVSGLLDEIRPDIAGNVTELDRLSQVVNNDSGRLNTLLQELPGYYQHLGRAGIYQQGFQFYLCGVQIRLALPTGPPIMTDTIASQEPRCQF
jgi:phospholipid/cholesterol/gamma-HCH transport system substrate-binding protein